MFSLDVTDLPVLTRPQQPWARPLPKGFISTPLSLQRFCLQTQLHSDVLETRISIQAFWKATVSIKHTWYLQSFGKIHKDVKNRWTDWQESPHIPQQGNMAISRALDSIYLGVSHRGLGTNTSCKLSHQSKGKADMSHGWRSILGLWSSTGSPFPSRGNDALCAKDANLPLLPHPPPPLHPPMLSLLLVHFHRRHHLLLALVSRGPNDYIPMTSPTHNFYWTKESDI